MELIELMIEVQSTDTVQISVVVKSELELNKGGKKKGEKKSKEKKTMRMRCSEPFPVHIYRGNPPLSPPPLCWFLCA